MTRAEILEVYTVENGIITSPGKYEGEPIYAPAFGEFYDDEFDFGCGDTGEVDLYGVVNLNDDDRAEWPELAGVTHLIIRETNQGFVEVTEANADQVADLAAEYESFIEEQESEDSAA